MMFRLIGNISKKVYYESENASDLNKWRLNEFVEDRYKKGGSMSSYEAPEAMVIVKDKANKSRRECLHDLLDQGKDEQYRRMTIENSRRNIEIYGRGKDKPALINRRKNV